MACSPSNSNFRTHAAQQSAARAAWPPRSAGGARTATSEHLQALTPLSLAPAAGVKASTQGAFRNTGPGESVAPRSERLSAARPGTIDGIYTDRRPATRKTEDGHPQHARSDATSDGGQGELQTRVGRNVRPAQDALAAAGCSVRSTSEYSGPRRRMSFLKVDHRRDRRMNPPEAMPSERRVWLRERKDPLS